MNSKANYSLCYRFSNPLKGFDSRLLDCFRRVVIFFALAFSGVALANPVHYWFFWDVPSMLYATPEAALASHGDSVCSSRYPPSSEPTAWVYVGGYRLGRPQGVQPFSCFVSRSWGGGYQFWAFGGIVELRTCPATTPYFWPSTSSCNATPPPIITSTKNLGEPKQCVGNPCNPATGNKYQSEIDYRNPDNRLTFTRSYNSGASKDIGLGFGWGTNAGAYLEINGTTLTVWRGDGRGERFSKNASGVWRGDTDSELILTEDSTGFTLTFADGAAERYGLSGKLLTHTNRTGLTYTYGYNAQGKLDSLTGPFGQRLLFGYDASSHLATLTDPAGKLYSYAFDANNNLIRVTYPDGKFKTYHYENVTFPHHLTGISDENGNRFATWSYDAQGRAITSQHAVTDNGSAQERYALSYDSDTQTTVTDAIGNKETLSFGITLGVKNLLSRIYQSDGKGIKQSFDANNNRISETDAEGRITAYTYNATNQRTSATVASGTPEARTTSYQYLSGILDLPTVIESSSVFAGAKKQTTITYDASRNPVQMTQKGYTPTGTPVTRTIKLAYNAQGQVTQIDGPRLDVADLTTLEYYPCATGGACGQLKRLANARGQATIYDAYDAHGRLLQLTDPNGVKTSYAYDARGRVLTVTVTPPAGAIRVTHYSYDAAGQITSVTTPDGIKLTYTYDAAHYLRSITDNLGNKVQYKYDLKGNRTQALTRDPDSTLVRQIDTAYDLRNRASQINAAGSLTQQVHDAVGNLTQSTDPNVHSATHNYDPLNRLLRSVDALSGNTQYSYDANDQLTRVTAPNNAATHYVYDDLGNLLSETSPDRGVTTYAYDAAGEVTQHTDARGITVNYTYDTLGRITLIDYPGTTEDATFTYDSSLMGVPCTFGTGKLCQVQDQSGLTQYAYDGFGNLTQEAHIELGVTYTTRYTYDAGDRIAAITYPGGRQVTYSRDTVGRIASVSALLNGQPVTLTRQRSYRADGLLKAQIFGNNLNEQRTYDLQGRLTSQSLGSVDSRSYAYDPAGNVTQKQGSGMANYSYDALDRLTREASAVVGQFGYNYDPNGNRLSLFDNGETKNYAYSPNTNRLTQANNKDWVLDAAGNTLTKDNGKWRFEYLSSGRLFKVYKERKWVATYLYNAQGLRTQKTTKHGTTVYHYDMQGRLLAETTDRGNLIRAYVWLEDQPLVQIDRHGKGEEKYKKAKPAKETIAYLHVDHLGTPRLATDASQQIVWRWDSDAFGAKKPDDLDDDHDGDDDRTITVNLRFPGQYADKETKLFYNWNRYYDPKTGRYISSDPIGLAGGLNTYAYVLNNPLRYIDPTGLDATVTLYPGASGFGHVGIGVNSPNTTGFYPSPDASTWDVITGQPVPGVMQPDTRTPTQTITIPATPAQDKAIQDYINSRIANPGNYDLNDRNCTTTIRDALDAAGINTPASIYPKELIRDLQRQFGGRQ